MMTLLFILPVVILLLYRKRKLTNLVKVPSLMFLEALKTTVRKSKSFSFPPKLFLDILILALLATAANQLLQKPESKLTEILIDNSFHSKAILDDGKSVLDKYKESISARLGSGLFILKQTSPAKTLTTSPVTKAELLANLATVSSSSQEAESLRLRPGSLVASLKDTGEFVKAGDFQEVQNIFIKSVVSDSENLSILVGASIKRASSVTVKVLKQKKLVFQESLTLSKDTLVATDLSPSEEYEIYLDSSVDQLSQDNYYKYVGDKSITRVVNFISEQNPGEIFLPDFSIRKVAPQDYTSVNRGVAVFYKFVPPEKPSIPAILILPNRPLKDVYTEPVIETEPEILKWDTGKDVMRFLKPELLSPKAVVSFKSEQLAEIISTKKGSVLSLGDSIAVTGLDLLPFKGADTPFRSILLLNLINWAASQGEVKLISLRESDTLNLPPLLISATEESLRHNWWKELSYLVLLAMFLNLLLMNNPRYQSC